MLFNLTPREQDILNMLLEGTSPKEIGSKLNISYHTVDFHRTKIYRKLGVKSFHELISMYGKQSTAIQSEEPAASPWYLEKRFKLLIAAAALILAVSILSVWFFSAKPSAEAASNNSVIILDNGTTFTARTYDTIRLRAQRWTYKNPQTGFNEWGENYGSVNSIKLRDIYNGTFDQLIEVSAGEIITFKISGTVDIELKNIGIALQYLINNNRSKIGVCGSNLSTTRYKMGPGAFSIDIFLYKNGVDIESLPEGEIIVEICEHLSWQTDDQDKKTWGFVDGALPAHIPDGTIMATIRNLKIELIKS